MSEFRRQASVLFVLGSAIFLGTTSVNLQELFGLYGGTQGNAEGFFGRSITGSAMTRSLRHIKDIL